MNITIRDAIDFFLKPVWWLDIPQYWAYSSDAGHCSADFSCDPFHIDGYRYNPADGKWYSTPPNPVMGDWSWHDPAPPEKQSIYTDMQNSVINYRKTISPPVDSIKGKLNAARSVSSPILLDLDGDGIETTAVTAGSYFDHQTDGFAERTGWVGRDDGLLVLDRNGNGRIDDGGELFGAETRLTKIGSYTRTDGSRRIACVGGVRRLSARPISFGGWSSRFLLDYPAKKFQHA